MAKNKYESSKDPKHCSHPDQRPIIVPDPTGPSGRSTGASCGDCKKSWPK